MGHFADGVSELISLLSETRGRSSKQQIKQKYKPNHQQTGLPPQSALPIRGKTNKQTNKTQCKSHSIQSLHKPLDLGGQETKRKKKKKLNLEGWEKETSITVSLKKIMKRQKNTTQMKEQSRNKEVQIMKRK